MVLAALLAAADGYYGEEEALCWANGFRSPQEVFVRDMSLLYALTIASVVGSSVFPGM